MKKKIPLFKNEDEERDFWAKADSTEYIDWQKAEKVSFSFQKTSNESDDNLSNDAKKITNEVDEFWDKNNWDDNTINALKNEHPRTKYEQT